MLNVSTGHIINTLQSEKMSNLDIENEIYTLQYFFFFFFLDGPKNTSVSVRPSTEVDKGSNITLICSTTANPAVENYTWFKSGDDDMIVGNGPELNFVEIYPHDGGQYLCRVINKHGHQNSSIVTIKVKGKMVNIFILLVIKCNSQIKS